MRERCGAFLSLATLLACAFIATSMAEELPDSAVSVLAWINGEAIMVSDLDALLLSSHQSRDMNTLHAADLTNFMNKAINDLLIVQDAMTLGMDMEESVRETADEVLKNVAIDIFTNENFDLPGEVDSLLLHNFFLENYWKIHLRQISLRAVEEAEATRRAVLGGADMDSLARARSLDSRNVQGGLHNLKFWADVEVPLRDASRNLSPGEVSEVFPYREAFSFLRVEELADPAADDFEVKRERIRDILLNQKREAAWAVFLDSLESDSPLLVNENAMDAVRADSALIFTGTFLRDQNETILSVSGVETLSGTQFRRTASHAAMMDGTAPFDSILNAALRTDRQQLLLLHHSSLGGYFENPKALQYRRKKLKETLIQRYLNEMIVPRIVFRRDEFQNYYDSNPDRFRGEDEVRMEMLVIEDEHDARAMCARLDEGADFDFLRSQYQADSQEKGEAVRWVSTGVFSNAIRDEVRGKMPGDTSQPVETHGGWLIFKLTGRRAGEVRPLAEVEMQIREIMFQVKFNELLDEHLSLLREHSEIRMNQEAIDDYFGQGS